MTIHPTTDPTTARPPTTGPTAATTEADLTPAGPTRRPRAPRYVQIAAWAVPVMMIGQFALLALVPVLVVLIGSLVDARARYLRGWAAGLAAVFAAPLAVWALRADPAQSLSKDIDLPLLVAVVVAAAAVLARLYVGRRR